MCMNFGVKNSGNYNSGHFNSGECNSGSRNSGSRNSGDYNSGNYNIGHYNSGNFNSGYYNSGHYNIGHYNSGNHNIGYFNSGDYNSGDYNSGDFNNTDGSSGCFNTSQNTIFMFDKPSDWTLEDWRSSEACSVLRKIPKRKLKYITLSQMTDAEKEEHPEALVTGGYLKEVTNRSKVNGWWRSLSEHERQTVISLPNFDKEIFKKITGIEVDNDD